MRFAAFALLILGAASVAAQTTSPTPDDPYGIFKRLAKLRKQTIWKVYAQASGDGWTKSDYVVMTFDPSRVDRVAGGHFRVWTRQDYAEKQTFTQNNVSYPYDYLIALEEVNCTRLERRGIRTLLYYYVDEDQDTAEADYDWKFSGKREDLRWDTAVPGSTGEATLKLLCSQLKSLTRSK